jgi:hypothetical protein
MVEVPVGDKDGIERQRLPLDEASQPLGLTPRVYRTGPPLVIPHEIAVSL